MEAALFTLDCLVMVLLAFMSVRDEAKAGRSKAKSPFRMRDEKLDEAAPKTAQVEAAGWAPWEQPAARPDGSAEWAP